MAIIEEQHPDRCQLFMQWKRMDFPVMVDRLNLLGVRAVPITALIDEAGVVRAIGPSKEEVEAFIASPPPDPEPFEERPGAFAPRGEGAPSEPWMNLRDKADRYALWGGPAQFDLAIDYYERVLEDAPEDGPTHFRLGSTYRRRFDSPGRREGDFAGAIRHWEAALRAEPNQYIWRRRIQQYGPRSDKPYPFYDWVREAIDEIRERGEEPIHLEVMPGGAEIASPREREKDEQPTAGGKTLIWEASLECDAGLIEIDVASVDSTDGEPAARVHVMLRPIGEAHWNNEGEGCVVGLSVPSGWACEPAAVVFRRADQAVSTEERHAEFEVRWTGEGEAPTLESAVARAMYDACEGEEGACRRVRQERAIVRPG
ncbi:MAG: hypothetical protein H6811_02935 [Phycisphaeraceae bacterium]|nr:hypothetical protein [Phycisphaeraceae bacterium]